MTGVTNWAEDEKIPIYEAGRASPGSLRKIARSALIDSLAV